MSDRAMNSFPSGPLAGYEQSTGDVIRGIWRSLAARVRIAGAVAMRQIKIRSGHDWYGYLFEIIEPVIIISLFSLMMTMHRAVSPPVGDSYPLFIATGYLPFKAFSFISNDLRRALGRDSGIFDVPMVNHFDAIFGVFLLKALTVLVIVMVVIVGMNLVGFTVVPGDPLDSLAGLAFMGLFAFGFGLLISVITEVFPMLSYLYKMLTYKLLFVSGVFFLPELMPPELRYYLAYNPLLHGIAWFRSAFIDGFDSSVLDRGYFVWWTLGIVAAAFLSLRVCRARLVDA